MSFSDLKFKLRTQLSLEQLKGVLTFQAVAEVVSLAFGGKRQETDENVREFKPQTANEAIMMFKKFSSGANG